MPEIPSAEQSISGIVNEFHGIAEGHRPMQGGLGKIISPPPDIVIQWNGIQLTKKDIFLNEYWLPGHRREAKGKIISGTQPAGHHGHTHGIANSYTDDIIYTDTLKPGDLVSVYPIEFEGEQLFMVESKMVRL